MLNITETINSEHILAGISRNNRHYLTKLDIFDAINSTNSYLLKQINKKTLSGWVCIANQQMFGKGRQEKVWHSPPGKNIYCSIFWRFKQLPHGMSGLGIAIAVMLAKMLHKHLAIPIQLKWPNDVWVYEKKLGGILLESNAPLSVVLGIGLNVYLPDQCLQELPQAIALTTIAKQPIKRNELIALILDTLFSQLPIYEAKGLSVFLKDWAEFDALKDKNIIIYTPKMEIQGIMRGVNEKGELILEDQAGLLHYFCYGEVSVRY